MLSYSLLTTPNENEAPPIISALANQVLGAYCGAFSNYLTLNPLYGLVPGLPELATTLHRHACNRANPPVPLPEPDWDSRKGKCPVPYNVSVRYRHMRCYQGGCFVNQPPHQDTTYTNLKGPIMGLDIRDGWMGIIYDGGAQFQNAVFPGLSLEWFKIISLQRSDGQPDACGDYPQSLPTYPPGGTNLAPTNIPFLPPGSPPGRLPIPIPVFPMPIIIIPKINFSPVLNFDAGGINLTFDMRGWQFSVPIDVDVPITINFGGGENGPPPYRRLPPVPPSDPNAPPPGGKADVDFKPVLDKVKEVKDQTDDIEEKIDDLLECPCESLAGLSLYPVAVNTAGGVYSLPSDTKAVRVTLTGTPTKRSEQDGNGGENLQYAGWIAFRYAGGYTEMASLRFTETTHPCRPGVTGLTITVYDGRKANVQRLQ